MTIQFRTTFSLSTTTPRPSTVEEGINRPVVSKRRSDSIRENGASKKEMKMGRKRKYKKYPFPSIRTNLQINLAPKNLENIFLFKKFPRRKGRAIFRSRPSTKKMSPVHFFSNVFPYLIGRAIIFLKLSPVLKTTKKLSPVMPCSKIIRVSCFSPVLLYAGSTSFFVIFFVIMIFDQLEFYI